MQNTPKGLRLQIGILGRRNAGKSSLLNALVRQDVSIVSDVPGTTADPVEKAMELLPLGPVLFIDTAGIDDDAAGIGAKRVERSLKAIDRCDMALLVCAEGEWSEYEENLLQAFRTHAITSIVVFNKCDLQSPDSSLTERFLAEHQAYVRLSARTGEGLAELRELLIKLAPEDFLSSQKMLGGLTQPFRPVLLITPVDKEAPKGRMILPEVQAIRDTLDHDAWCVVVKENAVEAALRELKTLPVLAVTDSQAFGTVSARIPSAVPLTSFSILLARMKGDLATCAQGAASIRKLRDGSKILIAEACSHHPIGEDIGRVKIPRWLREYTKAELEITTVQGADFPDDPSGFDLVIHCGACTFNRRGVLSRMLRCAEHGVPFTNYGVAIAFLHGILERALAPFPDALAAYRNVK